MQKISDNSLRRRLKKRVLTSPHDYFAVCAPGFEKILEAEVASLTKVERVWATKGGVGFSGPIDCVYQANVLLNTAHRILLRLGTFSASTFTMLYDQIGRLDWELWIANNSSYGLKVASKASKLNMKERVLDTCRSAIEGRLSSLGIQARYDSASSRIFRLRLLRDHAILSFDTTGEHLHRRGYKPFSVTAPIRETLACAILLTTEFRQYGLIVDPFCGSGTFLIEGARMAKGLPPGINREFAFARAPFFRNGSLKRAATGIAPSQPSQTRFIGFDISEKAVAAATANCALASVANSVEVSQGDFFDLRVRDLGAATEHKLLVTNPPYGKRLPVIGAGEQDIVEQIVQTLSGWSIALVSRANLAEASGVGRYARKVVSNGIVKPMQNGGIQCHLHLFDVP